MTPSSDETTYHVRLAVVGNRESLGWLVSHLAPVLLAQARFRLSRHPPSFYDAEDLVSDTWIIAIPKLAAIKPRGDRLTPVLVRFLSTTLMNRYHNILQLRMARQKVSLWSDAAADEELDQNPQEISEVVALAVRSEETLEVLAAVERLSRQDREIIVLRAIEQRSNKEASGILQLPPNTTAARYMRALRRLRQTLKKSVFDELDEVPG